MSVEQLPDDHFRPTYEDIHVQIGEAARRIKTEFDPDLMVAIGGGGFYPARVLRTFLKKPSALDPCKMRNIPIQAIGLSLYEEVSGTSEGQIGTEVVRTQWLDAKTVSGGKGPGKIEEGKDAGGLLGKNVLIVDEVDDSRTTLQYAYSELLKDVKNAIANLSPEERHNLAPTRFAIFVVHNKEKAEGKRGTLPILPKNRITRVHVDSDLAPPGAADTYRLTVFLCLLLCSAGTSSSTTVLLLLPRSSVSTSQTRHRRSRQLEYALPRPHTYTHSIQSCSISLLLYIIQHRHGALYILDPTGPGRALPRCSSGVFAAAECHPQQ